MTAAATHPTPQMDSRSSGPMGWLASAERWLDERGKPAWIGATILGFIVFWPIGLFLLFYMLFFRRHGGMTGGRAKRMRHGIRRMAGSSGNSAFDAYKAETLRRLEEEQDNFEAFLERLREAKDKAEFDQFMNERARKSRRTDTGPDDEGPNGHDNGNGNGNGDDDDALREPRDAA